MEILAKQKIIADLLPKKFGLMGRLWVVVLVIICIIGAVGYGRQLSNGLVVSTDMRDYASWGIYISNFVFFVAISLVGSLVTAVLRLVNVKWSTPLTRIAEIIAISAITFASIIIVVDMGRPDRFYNLFFHGRLQSPIIWDVVVITTYFFISLLLLYFPLLPDFKIMLSTRKEAGKRRGGIYAFLGSFWKNTPKQIQISERSIRILSITIIPVAFAVHTVTSWLFATTYRPGWDSTNFGAYFIAGAFLVGAGSILVAMYIFRYAYKLENYIKPSHFDMMGKIVVMLALVYLYFNVNEFLVPAFKMKKTDEDHLMGLFKGEFAAIFWFAITTSMFLPILILVTRKGRKPFPAFIAGVLVVVGSWFKRYVIVTPTLLHPFLPMYDVPESYKHYFSSWEEWAVAMGSLAGMLLIVTFFPEFSPSSQYRRQSPKSKSMKKFKYPGLVISMILLASGVLLAQVEKNKLICGLAYYNDNNLMQYLKVNTKTKIDGSFMPVGGIRISLYISSETPANLLGSVKTDDKGQAALNIPPSAKDEWNKSPKQTFLAVTDSSPSYDAVTTSIDLAKARIRLDTAEDRKIIATVVEQKKSAWVPVKGVDLKLGVKRLGGDLSINETPVFTTDSLGVVNADFKLLNLPGDSRGSLILVARIEDNDAYGNMTAERRVPWGIASEYVSEYNKRTLFARRGWSPFWLQWIAYGIIVTVWSVLIYLFFQIRELKKLGVEPYPKI